MIASADQQVQARSWRLWLIFSLLALIAAGIVTKLVSLYTLDQAFLQRQGDARSLRTMLSPAHRGLILDRNGEPLAVSAPVATIWADPLHCDLAEEKLPRLAKSLAQPRAQLLEKLKVSKAANKRFIYLKRQVTPEVADAIAALKIRCINVDREYKRYYPAAEVATHLVGFTNLDGKGIDGMEKAYDSALSGDPGRKLVMQDRLGRTIKHIKSIEQEQPGKDLQLSIDLRLQYQAYRELKAVVQSHQADSASLVIVDIATGEVLAMVNQPSYNPNDRSAVVGEQLRNRAVTDLFEPGSTMKPITVAAALMSGDYTPETVLDTSPGYIRVLGRTIRDHRNYGEIDLTKVITKSSNVGVTQLALALPADAIRNLYLNMGLGSSTGSGFPGERSGSVPFYPEKRKVERATMSYGYGLSVTPLQLAQAYQVLGNGGMKVPLSLLKVEQPERGVRVMPKSVADDVVKMMETVTQPNKGGTGRRAAIYGYRVGGKTGTTHKVTSQGYAADQYVSVFAGVAPVSNPRLAAVVMVDNPKGREYYGGEVAAPVFSRVLAAGLRTLNVPPDQWPEQGLEVAGQ